jgi:hypothetical protein
MTLHFARVTGYVATVSAPGMDKKTESHQRLGAI